MALKDVIAEKRKKIEEFKKQGEGKNPLDDVLKVALGVGVGYLTGGLGSALLPTALGGTGAGIGAALAPSAANVLPAIQAGSEILKKPDQDALSVGLEKGVELPLEGMKATAEKSILDKLGYKGRSTKIGGTTGTAPAFVAKVPVGKTPPAVSIGRLSSSGASAFSAGQAALAGGADLAMVTNAVSDASDIPEKEKPIIIKNLKASKKREK